MATAATQWATQAPSNVSHKKSASASCERSASKHHSDIHDRFYGHRQLSELSEAVISALFACPLDSTSSNVNGAQTLQSNERPTPRLAEFIAYALHRTRLPDEITFQALFLLRRLKSRFPAARGSSGHRLFVSALMLASKSSCDDTYSNKSWTIVSQGLFSLREVNQMERELFGYLGYKVNVEYEELHAFTSLLQQGDIAAVVDLNHGSSVVASPSIPDSVTDAYGKAPGYINNPVAAPLYGQSMQRLSPSMTSRGSVSSIASGYSMIPSPTAMSMSGESSSTSSRASPDTPPSDFDTSPWVDDGKGNFSGQPAGTYDDQYRFYHQSLKQQQQQQTHQQYFAAQQVYIPDVRQGHQY